MVRGDFLKKTNTYEFFDGYIKLWDSKHLNYSLIDNEDLQKVTPYCFYKDRGGYFIANTVVDGKKTTIKLHRLVMDSPVGLQIDHLNHKTYDNRKCNLRVCTNQENSRNKRSKGYSYWKYGKRWEAYIFIDYKKVHLGYFNTEDEAKRARREAEHVYFGNFAFKEVV